MMEHFDVEEAERILRDAEAVVSELMLNLDEEANRFRSDWIRGPGIQNPVYELRRTIFMSTSSTELPLIGLLRSSF